MAKSKSIPTSNQTKSFEQIIFEEGFSDLYMTGSAPTITISSGGSVQISITPNYTSQVFQIIKAKTEIQWSSSAPIYFAGGQRSQFGPNDTFIHGNGSTSGKFQFSVDFPNYPSHNITAYGASGTTINFGATTSYTIITNDFNFDAEETVLWVGDSVTLGTINSDMTRNQLFHFQTKHFLENKFQKKYRNVIVAKGGKQTNDFVSLWRRNMILTTTPKIIFFMTGINDQSQGISLTTFEANLREIIDIKNKKYPNTILCLMSATPVEGNTRETALVSYRQKMSDIVTSINDPYLKYIDMTNAFDRTLGSAIYATSDGAAGDRIHPGTELSHTGIANRIISNINTYNF